jgi:phytoene synthase
MSAAAIDRSSFGRAARLLGRERGDAVRRLYAACRAVDDLADETGGPEGAAALARLRLDLHARRPGPGPAAEFLDLHARHGLSLAPVGHLANTVASDLTHRPFETEAQLMQYAHGVAGTVGLMMCDLLGVSDAAARARAARLGRAMQLTNIARDVVEDARMGRRYLPAAWGAPAPEALAEPGPGALAALRPALAIALDRAERDYEAGRAGLSALDLRARLAVALASRTYRDIGRRIAREGYRPLPGAGRPRRWRPARPRRAGLGEAVHRGAARHG